MTRKEIPLTRKEKGLVAAAVGLGWGALVSGVVAVVGVGALATNGCQYSQSVAILNRYDETSTWSEAKRNSVIERAGEAGEAYGRALNTLNFYNNDPKVHFGEKLFGWYGAKCAARDYINSHPEQREAGEKWAKENPKGVNIDFGPDF